MHDTCGRILIIDDDAEILALIRQTLSNPRFVVSATTDHNQVLELLRQERFDLVISDLMLADETTGLELLEKIQAENHDCDFIVLTGHGSVETAVQALKMGAFDYLAKPFDPDELVSTVERVFAFRDLAEDNMRLRHNLAEREGISPYIAGSSESMRRVTNVVRAVAPMPTSVLIRGESGTGKEVIADEIHRLSPRADQLLIKVNCAALPENLLEDELFGHEKGSFTGAMQKRIGRFEQADGGTIFLDEIAEMSPLLQAKLLRVLQEKSFQRVGSNLDINVDVRVICATNTDLEAAVAQGKFREDLYYRVNVIQIELPPLRDRKEDIPALASALLRKISLRLGLSARTLSASALRKLQSMDFPGNVRELQNLLERSLVFCRGREVMAEDIPVGNDYPVSLDQAYSPEPETQPTREKRGGTRTLEEIEREAIMEALESTGGNMYRAAKALDISRSTLYSKVKKLNLVQRVCEKSD
jgi:two-component system NtrC family response regulator